MANESEVPPSDWLPDAPTTSREEQAAGAPYAKILVVYACVLVSGMSLAWAFLSMRAVMGVGGSCGGDGTYVAAPCPDGSWLIALAIPALLISMFVGSGVGMSIGAPALLLPMWGFLFGLLGWNFFEFGFGGGGRDGDIEVGLIVCGVLFWAMALPAFVAMGVALRNGIRKSLKLQVNEKQRRKTREEKQLEKRAPKGPWSASSLGGSLWWWLIYAVLYAGGALFGVAIYAAVS